MCLNTFRLPGCKNQAVLAYLKFCPPSLLLVTSCARLLPGLDPFPSSMCRDMVGVMGRAMLMRARGGLLRRHCCLAVKSDGHFWLSHCRLMRGPRATGWLGQVLL